MTSIRLKGRCLNVLEYINQRQIQVAFSQFSLYDNATVAIIERHQQCTKYGRLITSNTLYREVL